MCLKIDVTDSVQIFLGTKRPPLHDACIIVPDLIRCWTSAVKLLGQVGTACSIIIYFGHPKKKKVYSLRPNLTTPVRFKKCPK